MPRRHHSQVLTLEDLPDYSAADAEAKEINNETLLLLQKSNIPKMDESLLDFFDVQSRNSVIATNSLMKMVTNSLGLGTNIDTHGAQNSEYINNKEININNISNEMTNNNTDMTNNEGSNKESYLNMNFMTMNAGSNTKLMKREVDRQIDGAVLENCSDIYGNWLRCSKNDKNIASKQMACAEAYNAFVKCQKFNRKIFQESGWINANVVRKREIQDSAYTLFVKQFGPDGLRNPDIDMAMERDIRNLPRE